MTTRLLVGALFVAGFTWLITYLVNHWADREAQRQQEERQMFDKIMAASEPPRAPGLRGQSRRVS